MEFSSVTEAVQSALDIQEAMTQRNAAVPPGRRLQFRMGINLGEIITEGEDIYGTGVNVAARLESLAEPGGICTSASVHEQIQSLQGLGFEDLGDQIVKNLSRPVRSFALRSTSSGAVAFQRISRAHAQGSEAEHGAHRRVPSIAVLPFSNLSGDPEQEYFADGIAEDIITALSKISNLLTRSDDDRARAFFRKSIELDPHCAMGLVWLAWAYWSDARFHWTESPKDALARADELARCATEIDDSYSECHALLGAIYLMKKSYDEAIHHGVRAIELEPNAADATATLAMTLNWVRPARGGERARQEGDAPKPDSFRLVSFGARACLSANAALRRGHRGL